jgi:HSP20 family protein
MDMGKFEPARAMKSLRNEIDTLFDRFIERPLSTLTGQLVPPLDISETDTEISVKMEIPGIEEENMDVSIVNDVLTVRGEKKREREESSKIYHVTERTYGTFTRSVTLPVAVRVDMIRASYKKGILEINLPKKELTQAKKIEIQTEPSEQTTCGSV